MTSNEAKFREIRLLLRERGIDVNLLRTEYPEVQADRLEDVVRSALEWLAPRHGDGLMVDDSGLFIRALTGFPGVYSSYVYRTLGGEGILRLLQDVADRRATFRTVIGLRDGGEDHVFRGTCQGAISERPRGSGGFGFDPIFVPDGSSSTFAEMTRTEKNAVSHRGRAADALVDHLTQREETR